MLFCRQIFRLILLPCIMGVIVSQTAVAQTTRVLLIAVSSCDHPGISPLPFTSNDVARLAKTLRERNEFTEVRILSDDSGVRPTRNTIGYEIKDWLIKESDEQDTIIIYFSGHGFVDPEKATSTYLVSCDFDPERPESGVPIDGIRKLLNRCRAKHKFVIIDSCHAGAKSLGETTIDPLSQFANYQGVITLGSAKFGEKSLIWEDREMSLFSYWLNEGLKGHADEDRDTVISVDELYRYVFKNVVHCNRIVSHKQSQTPVRIIGPDIVGVPPVVRLKPTGLETLLDDIAEQVAMQLSLNRINRMGILDFTIESQGNFTWSKEQYELLQQYSVHEIERRVKKLLKKDTYTVYDREQTREALTKSFDAVNSTNADHHFTTDPVSLTIQGKQVGAVLSGNVLGRQVHRFSMQCRLSHPMRNELIAIAGGTATFSPEDWAMLGISVDLLPLAGPKIQNRIAIARDMGDSAESQNAVRERITKSLGDLSLDDVLDMPGGASRRLLAKLDSLSESPHPFLNEEYPFQLEIRVQDTNSNYTDVRKPILVGNELYVPLEEGEIYQIRVSPKSNSDIFDHTMSCLGVKVLVDGLNTFPEEDDSEEDVTVLRYVQAARVSIEQATAWSIPWDKTLEINGFYTKPTSKTNAKYNEFQVTLAGESHAAAIWKSDLKQIGLITIAFYPDLTLPSMQKVARGGKAPETTTRLGTKLGEQHFSEMEFKSCENLGTLLSLVHLRYDSKENIEKLQSQLIQEYDYHE